MSLDFRFNCNYKVVVYLCLLENSSMALQKVQKKNRKVISILKSFISIFLDSSVSNNPFDNTL